MATMSGQAVACELPQLRLQNGVPLDADMVFDVRFLPNPHFVPEFRKKTGKDPKVAASCAAFRN